MPLVSAGDCISALSFSTMNTPLTLMTATKEGNVVLWMPRESEEKFQPLAVNTWSSEKVGISCVRSRLGGVMCVD